MSNEAAPDSVLELQRLFGAPSAAGFGSAVFHKDPKGQKELEEVALGVYREFVGALWEKVGGERWASQWRRVYSRPEGGARQVVAELRAVSDRDVAQLIPMVLDEIDDPVAGQAALALIFDDQSVESLAVFAIGDGEAMSGFVVSGSEASGASTHLVLLLD